MKKFLLVLIALFLAPHACFGAELNDLNKAGLDKLLAQNKGKVVMLNFFATWCPPCRVELPELVKLRDEIPESRLVVIGLSVDENKAAVPPFIKQSGVNYPVYYAGKDITDSFDISSVPHNAFFAPDGRLVISEPGMAELNVMKEVVNELNPRK